jgi:hypothetical protein
MTESTSGGAVPGPKPLLARVAGILFAPRDTFASVAAHPRWLGMLALTTLVPAVIMYVFLGTDVGRQAVVDQQVSSLESFGQTVDDAAYARLEKQSEFARFINPAVIVVFAPLMTALITGILFSVFTVLLGGDATFKQVFAIVTHSGAVTLLQQVFVTPLNYVRESLSSPTNLSVFFPMLSETSFLASFLGTIDLFFVWWVFVLAIGLAVLYRRPTRPIAIGLLGVYALIGLAIAAVKAAMTGTS